MRSILPSGKRLSDPTYGADVTGEITRWDERDILFARRDLFRFFGAGTPVFNSYYDDHPDYLEFDKAVDNMGELGRTGGVDEPMFEAQFLATRAIALEAYVDGESSKEKADIPPHRAAIKIKRFARLLGADLVGVGPLRQEWVYSHVGRTFGNRDGFARWGDPVDLGRHTHAISMGFEMDYGLLRSAPDFPILLATAKGYGIGAWVSTQLARYIRMLGYSARAHHMYNYRLLSVPVAVDCGLGELSRAGYLITAKYGLGLRLATVTTDMPLVKDRPLDLAAQSFCDACKICAENCPIGAIPEGDKTVYNGVRKWKLDEDKCYRYWHAVGTDCSLCMITCPWTKPQSWLHRLLSSMAVIKGPHQEWLTKAEKVFYGKFKGAGRPGFIDPYGH
jgi:hypothetical protein